MSVRFLSRLLKPLALGALLCAFIAVGHTAARADEVSVAGFTNGCFNCATPPTTSAQQTATLIGLTYNNSTFSGTTSNGFLAIGNTGQPPGTANVDNLGSFTLAGSPANYNGNTFVLRVTFTLPPNVAPNGQTFTATLTGSVTSTDQGGVFIDFNNTPQTFTYSFVNAQGQTVTGSFNFNVNDVSVIAGGTIALSGNITGAQQSSVPEPTTMLLLGTGLAGVAGFARKRRRLAKALTE